MLLYSIDKDLFGKLEIGRLLTDQIKFYINPEMYKEEKSIEDETKIRYDRKNAIFEEQHRVASKTGVLRSPRFVREAIRDFYKDEENNEDIEPTLVSIDEDGKIKETPIPIDDEDTLG